MSINATDLFLLIFTLGTLASCAYLVITIVVCYQFKENRRQAREGVSRVETSAQLPAIAQIKPLHTAPEDTEIDCLKSFVNQEYAYNKVIFALNNIHNEDNRYEVEQKLLSLGSDIEISWGSVEALNNKIAVCLKAEEKAEGDLIVLSDADMIAPPRLLNDIVNLVNSEEVGLVTFLYTVKNMPSLGALYEGASVNDFCASVLVARLVEGVNFALGAVMAVKKEVLHNIGGLQAVKDYLADDYQLGFRTAQSGKRIVLANEVVEDVVGPISFTEYFSHQLRWMRTYRVSRPGGFWAFLITQGLFWSFMLIFTSVVAAPEAAVGTGALVGLWAVLRFVSFAYNWGVFSEHYDRFFDKKYLLVPYIKDFIYLVLWGLAWMGDTVEWGGKKFSVKPDGTLKPVNRL
ncbi:MAG: glycosyltransferase [Candidatus Bruticola sp.]